MHPIIEAAARGELPAWARVRAGRMIHLASVAELLARWSQTSPHSRGLSLEALWTIREACIAALAN